MERTKAVILAGGGGERFWPRSRPWLPKQFLDLDGGGSLLQRTYSRVRRLLPLASIYVATRAEHRDLVLQHLPDLPLDNLILEPAGRDTAPSLGLAALVLAQRDPDAIMVALPSDHLVADEDAFAAALRAAAEAAEQVGGLITLGIQPTRPETGYGYIQVGPVVASAGGLAVHRVARFVEKPDRATAEQYVESGQYLWNCGVFAWRVGTLLAEIHRHLPQLGAVLAELASASPGAFAQALAQVFPQAPKISIDYGVLEKSDRVYVVPAYFGWDDVGTWSAVARLRPRDPQGNAVRGPAILYDAHGVVVEGVPHRLVAAVGVRDLVIVDSDDAVLVCHKDRAQDVRHVAVQARQHPGGRPAFPPEPAGGRAVEHPWGREVWWAETPVYAARLLEVRAGHSVATGGEGAGHRTLYVLRGHGRLRVGDVWHPLGPGAVVAIPPGAGHHLVATGDLAAVEVVAPHPGGRGPEG